MVQRVVNKNLEKLCEVVGHKWHNSESLIYRTCEVCCRVDWLDNRGKWYRIDTSEEKGANDNENNRAL